MVKKKTLPPVSVTMLKNNFYKKKQEANPGS